MTTIYQSYDARVTGNRITITRTLAGASLSNVIDRAISLFESDTCELPDIVELRKLKEGNRYAV